MDRRWLVVGVAALISIGAGWWYGRGVTVSPSTPEPIGSGVTAGTGVVSIGGDAADEVEMVTVHVAGWVASPGLAVLPSGSRVSDALGEAGGVVPGARVAAVNLARVLVDGEQIVVPGPDATFNEPGVAAGDIDDGRVRVNTATASQLEALPGVGPVLAERIVSHRDTMGPFERVEDLLEVPGIGETKLAAMREAVVVP